MRDGRMLVQPRQSSSGKEIMSTATEGMSQRLARLRSESRTVTPSVASRSEPTESKSQTCLWCGNLHNGGPEFCDVELFASFESMSLRQFDDAIEPSPGYRLHAGEMWLAVTPELLGWMSARIEVGLRPSIASEDLGQAIDLFHRARDASGLEPVVVRSNWSPPGIGIKVPPEWR